MDAVLHKYEPPYLPSKDPNDGEKGAVPSSDKNPEKFVTVAGPPFLIRQDGLSIRRADNHTGEDDREAPHQNNDITRARLTEEQVKSVERTFEMGVCHLMGLGVSKNITKGIQCMVNAAMKGSLRARAMVLTLATSYSVAVDIPDEVLESWLCETSKCGSKIALRELQSQFPTKYKEIVAVNRFAFDLQHSEVFKHPKDVLPTCDWNDIAMISMEFKTAKSRLSGPPEADREEVLHLFKSMNSMALTSHGTDNYGNVKYYIFGTPLHLASLFGFEDAVEIFLDAGFDIDGHNSHPALRTPLLCALSRGHTAIATLLIKRGANCEPLMMWRVAEICSTPSPLHYLVNIDDDKEAVDLARLLVKGGADVNAKCDVKNLNNSMDIPVLNGNSVTPLRWAVIHEKVQLVKVLLTLGAKFAYEPYLTTVTHDEDSAKPKEQKGCLLLETPCTNLEILEMFFARARVPGLPTEFSQTPFGLLVSEDDGPERRLRPGFEDTNKVLDALRLLLDLQPGFEDVLLWSAVRHDHVDIVKYLLDDLGWDVECKWKGLTCLHTAVLYGRLEMVQYLLEFGADVTAVTETRGLTCLHLLMLYPRDPKTDQDILKSIASTSIDVNAKEKVDGLTALHIAVRNQKLQAVQELLRMGADPSIPVTDQLHILSQGKFGFLEKVPERLPIFTNNLTILGEVIIQYIQDSFYSHSYVADLLVLLVDFTTRGRPFTANDLIIDKGNGISLLHLLAITPFPESPPRIHWKQWHYFQPPTQTPTPPPITAPISLLQLLLIRTPSSLLNLRDYHNDTPLHYACAASQYHNIETLLSFGADRTLRNKLNLTPVETLAWSVLFLGGKTMHFQKPYKSWHPSLEFPGRFVYLDEHKVVKPKRSVQGANDLSRAFETFRGLGMVVDERLRRLVCAWEYAGAERDSRGDIIWSREDGSKKVLEIVPESSASGWDWEKETEQDSRVKEDGSYDAEWDKRIKRPYFYAAIGGPRREKRGGYWTEEFRKDERIEGERGAL